MTQAEYGSPLRQMQTLFQAGALGGLTDRQLLESYNTRCGQGVAAELAFSALVDRHGGMVLGVCRALLRDEHDAQDAFQTTFLVLMQRARTLWVRDSLGPWLHQVALRASSCARAAAARRRRHERCAAELVRTTKEDEVQDDAGAVLHEEIGRLPERYRRAIVLCYLEGRTQEQASRQLGWPLGTVQSRLARGRERLRSRLTRRGLTHLGISLGAAIGAESTVAAPVALIGGTVRAAALSGVAPGVAVMAGTRSAGVAELMKGVIRMMFFDNLKRFAAAALVVGMAATGVGVVARQPAKDGSEPPSRELAMKTLPEYVVEAPDLLRIEVNETLPDAPITGEHLVRPDGTISLGYYGSVYVSGLTLAEIKEKLIRHLRKHLSDEQLGLLVADRDRRGQFKRVSAADSVRILVEVTAYNSKAYYVVGDVRTPGRLPVTGNETVLDGITYAGGLLPTASMSNIRLVRLAPPGARGQQSLTIDYRAIVYDGDARTNYQLLPGDRLIVSRAADANAPPKFPEKPAAPAEPNQGTTESSRHEPKPAFQSSDAQALSRRLDAIERRLDRVIEILGDRVDPLPAPSSRQFQR